MKRITTMIIICLCMLLLCGCGAGREWIAAGTEDMPLTVSQFAKVYEDVREWARTPGNMEETVNPGLSISFINARYAYSGELDFGELTYVYSLSTRKITPLEGEYTGEKAYGVISGGYPMVFIFIDK